MFNTTKKLLLALGACCLTFASMNVAMGQEVLPFPPKPSGSIANRTMQESTYTPRAGQRRLPADAPNIIIVLTDDTGPAMPPTYGGEISTPTLDRIAKGGISFNRFHTTAMCSPTRAAHKTDNMYHAGWAWAGSTPYKATKLVASHFDIGTDLGSPVSLDYFDKAPFAFNGKISEVKVKYLKHLKQ